jgi:hypothetical protein
MTQTPTGLLDRAFLTQENSRIWEPEGRTADPDRSVPGFPATQRWTGQRVRLSVREGRMECTSATKFHRKSGEA